VSKFEKKFLEQKFVLENLAIIFQKIKKQGIGETSPGAKTHTLICK
jgi:hypothetical protein